MSLSPAVNKALELVRAGEVAAALSNPAISLRRQCYYHRQNYGTGGSTLFTFFNAQYADHTTNLPQPGQIPADSVFLLDRILIDIHPNEASTSAATIAAATHVAAALGSMVDTYELSQIADNGLVRVKHGDRIVAEAYGLKHFGMGSGPGITGSVSINAAHGNLSRLANTVDKEPGWKVSPAWEIGPQRTFSTTVAFNVAKPLTNNGNIICSLFGWLLGPANA